MSLEQWRQVRRRWEGSPNKGFQWLADEVTGAWSIELSRVAFQNMARRRGWVRGGAASSPLPQRAPAAAPVAPGWCEESTEDTELGAAAAKALQAFALTLSGKRSGATIVVLVLPATAAGK